MFLQVLPKEHDEKQALLIPNYRSFVFQVVPKASYEAQQEYDAAVLKQEEMNNRGQGLGLSLAKASKGGVTESLIKIDSAVMEEEITSASIAKLKVRAAMERELNKTSLSLKAGEVIQFGNDVNFIHKDSGRITEQTDIEDKTSFLIKLYDNGVPDLVDFQILSRYKYKQVGDKIVYEDNCLIFNPQMGSFVSMNLAKQIDQLKIGSFPQNYREQIQSLKQGPEETFQRHSVNSGINIDYSKIKIQVYQNLDKETHKYLKGGDIIRMQHTEMQSYIFTDYGCEKIEGLQRLWLRKNLGKDKGERTTSHDLFEVELDCNTQRGRNLTVEKDQSDNYTTEAFRLRHLNTGKLLYVFQSKESKKGYLCLLSPPQAGDKHSVENYLHQTLFRMELTIVYDEKKVKENSVIKIQHVKTGTFLTSAELEQDLERFNTIKTDGTGAEKADEVQIDLFKEELLIQTDQVIKEVMSPREGEDGRSMSQLRTSRQKEQNLESGLSDFQNVLYEPIQGPDDDIQLKPLHFQKMPNDEDVLQLQVPSDEEIHSAVYLHAFTGTFREFANNFARKNTSKVRNPSYLEDIIEKLKKLVCFLAGQDDINPYHFDGKPNSLRQKYAREIKVVDALCDMLYYAFNSEIYNLSVLTPEHSLTKIAWLIYRSLKHIVMENEKNEAYVAQWLGLFFEQAMSVSEDNNIMAEATITASISNNRTLLDKRINKQTIKNLVNEVASQKKKNERFLSLLSELCICKDEAVAKNQNIIVDLLINDQAKREAFQIPVRQKRLGGYEIKVKDQEIDQWVDLKDFKRFCQENGIDRYFLYFQAFIDLASALCYERNVTGITAFIEFFPLNLVFECIKNEELPKEMRARFTKLLLYLHIDENSQIEKMVIPVLSKNWTSVNKFSLGTLHKRDNIPDFIKGVMGFVRNYISDCNGKMASYEKHKNELTYSVLLLTKSLIEYGCYQDQDELISVIDPMITLMDGSQHVVYPSDAKLDAGQRNMERYEQNELNAMVMKCKTLMTEIMFIVMDLQNDIRINRILFQFKEKIAANVPSKKSSAKRQNSKIAMKKLSSAKIGSQKSLQRINQENQEEVAKLKEIVLDAIKEDNQLDLEELSISDFVCINLDLILYKEEALLNRSFELLIKFHQQKKDLMKLLNQIQVLESEESLKVLIQSEIECTKLRKQGEAAEFWIGTLDSNGVTQTMKTINILQYFIEVMKIIKIEPIPVEDTVGDDDDEQPVSSDKRGSSLAPSPQMSNQLVPVAQKKKIQKLGSRAINTFDKRNSFATHGRVNSTRTDEAGVIQIPKINEPENEENTMVIGQMPTTNFKIEEMRHFLETLVSFENEGIQEAEKSSFEIQKLLRNLRAHEQAMILIKQKRINECQNKKLYRSVLGKCYEFLIFFVTNNQENQNELLPYINQYFLDDMYLGIGAALLISEIMKNNSALTSTNNSGIIKRIIKFIESRNVENPIKTTHMRCLGVFMKYKDRILTQNQNEIITLMTNKDKKNIFQHLFNGEEGIRDLMQITGDFQSQVDELISDKTKGHSPKNPWNYVLPHRANFVISLYMIMGIATEGKNAITEVKCQSVCTLQSLLDTYRESEHIYPLKRYVLKFLADAYLDIERKLEDSLEECIWTFLEFISTDIENYITVSDDLDNEEFRMFTCVKMYTNGFKDNYLIKHLERFVYKGALETLYYIFQVNLIRIKEHSELVLSLMKQCMTLYEIAKKQSYKKQVVKLFKVIQRNSTLNKMAQMKLGKAFNDKIAAKKITNEGLAVAPLNSQKSSITLDPVTPGVKSVKSGISGDEKEETKARMLRRYLKDIQFDPEFIESQEDEFESLVVSILDIESKSNLGFEGKCTLHPEEIFRSLIKLTDVNDLQIDPYLLQFSLKILRKVIEIENVKNKDPAADWDTEDWEKFAENIEERQEMLAELDVVGLICRIISKDEGIEDSIFEEAILVSIALLLGGNAVVQEKFYQFFIDDLENKFLNSIKRKILEKFSKIKEKEVLKKQKADHDKKFKINSAEEELSAYQRELLEREEIIHQNQMKFLERILRFIQLLCENHNPRLQNHLRIQLTAQGQVIQKNFDFITQLCILLGSYQKIFNSNTIDLGNQILDTLIEVIQGPCRDNQKALISAKVIDFAREFILNYPFIDSPVVYQRMSELGFDMNGEMEIQELLEVVYPVNVMKRKFVTLMISLLEGEADTQIIERMTQSIGFSVFKQRMEEVFEFFIIEIKGLNKRQENLIKNTSLQELNGLLQYDSFDSSIGEGFDIYILFNILGDYNEKAKEQIDPDSFTDLNEKKAYEFFKYHSRRIEIAIEDQLQGIYFPKKPICQYLSQSKKKEFMANVNRDTPQEKVEGLHKTIPELMSEMTHYELLGRKTVKVTPAMLDTIFIASIGVSILINVLYLGFWERARIEEKKVNVHWIPEIIVFYAGYVQLALTVMCLLGYLLSHSTLKVAAQWTEYAQKYRQKHRNMKVEESIKRYKVHEMSINQTRYILHTRGPEAVEFNLEEKTNFGNLFTKLEYYSICVIFALKDPWIHYYITYMMLTYQGHFQFMFYYTCQILIYAVRIQTLTNVIKSITMNREQLILTSMLILILLYIYSCLGFFFISDMFYDFWINKWDDTNPGEDMCQELWQCYINVVSYGLRYGGGIGEYVRTQSYADNHLLYFIKFFYNFTFHILIIIIMLNLLFGIIIDTFAQLRDQKKKKQEDMLNCCFICNIGKQEFDRYGEGFDKHIDKDHNLWNYVYYIMHLKSKDHTEFLGIESYVWDKFNQDDISFFPMHRALILEKNNEKKEKDQAQVNIERLKELTEKMSLLQEFAAKKKS